MLTRASGMETTARVRATTMDKVILAHGGLYIPISREDVPFLSL